MARRQTMVITWMDGETKTCQFTHQETRNGELHLWTEYPGSLSVQQQWDEHWFTIGNIRSRAVMDP